MTTNDFPPQLVLQQLIQGFQVTQCIYVAAKLGIADLLKEGPRTSEDLAQATGTHAPSLYRVLRLLTAVSILTEGEARSFALTPLMKPQGKVLLVERVILTGTTPQVLVLESDVQMLVVAPGGKERTDAEYRALLSSAGFEVTQLIPVLTPFYLIEAVRV